MRYGSYHRTEEEWDMSEDNRVLARRIAALAGPIWNECYSGILPQRQIDHMLETFHSERTIYGELENGTVYRVITYDGKDVGYCGFAIDGGSVYLSKFYIAKGYRGKGLGRRYLSEIERYAEANGASRIHLRVNKRNVDSIASYKAWGFRIYEDAATDIGNGFIMDDHCMEKSL